MSLLQAGPGPAPGWPEWTGRAAVATYLGLPALLALTARLGAGGAGPYLLFILLTLLAAAAALVGRLLPAGLVLALALGLKLLGQAVHLLGWQSVMTSISAGRWTPADAMLLLALAWIAARRLSRSRRRPGAVAARAAAILAASLAAVFLLHVPRYATGIGLMIGGGPPAGPAQNAIGPGSRLPWLGLRSSRGEPLSLDEPGRIYILNFWATWCAPCLEELPELGALAGDLPRACRLIAVNTEELDAGEIAAFLAARNLENLRFATAGPDIQRSVGIGRIPLTLLVRDGMVLERYEGYRPDLVRRIRERVGGLLATGNDG